MVYCFIEERGALWCVTPSGLSLFELPERFALEPAARRVYQLLTARSVRRSGETAAQQRAHSAAADRQYLTAARRLSNIVVGPVVAELGRKRLLVVSDGRLQMIPFAAPPVPGDSAEVNRSYRGENTFRAIPVQ